MPNWTGIITNAGTLLLSEWVNEKTLTITSAQAGTGTVPAVALMGQTALVNPKQTAAIAGGREIEGVKRISLQVTAAETEYTLNQFGLYAKVDDGSPVLLAIYQNEKGIPIPSLSDTPNFLYTFQAAILVSNQGTWEVTISASASLTWELVGVPSGIAGLDATGKVPKEQLPAYSAADVGADPTGTANQAVSTHNTSPNAHTSLFATKQNKLTGKQGQVVGFDSQGNAQAQDPPSGGSGKRVCRFVVGTSTAGWTADDCDYLCDGTADDVEINAAIQALPSTGGEVVILDGTYNITATIAVNKDNVTLSGNGSATILKRMWNSSSAEGVITITASNGNCTIKNIQINGNNSSFTSTYNNGIYVNSGNYNSISGVITNYNAGNGIKVVGAITETTLVFNHALYNTKSGIYVAVPTNVFGNRPNISYNRCRSNGGYGIFIYYMNDPVIIGNNACYNDSDGLHIIKMDRGIVANNWFCGNKNDGINFSGYNTGGKVGNSTISGNFCSSNTRYGLYCDNVDRSAITGNVFYNNSYGMYLHSITKSSITGNVSYRDSYTGDQYSIRALSAAKNNLFVGNSIMGKNYVDEGTGNTWANNKYQ